MYSAKSTKLLKNVHELHGVELRLAQGEAYPQGLSRKG
jgi:hypothetical protein